MRISIVTLNYNGSKETLELLKFLKDQTDTDFEIIVVDNASEEADFTTLQTTCGQPTSQVVYPQVKVVRNSDNLGFSGGNNVGICQALNPSTRSGQETAPEWVVLLNNDTWVEEGFMERLKAVLSVKRGIVGIPLIEGARTAYCGRLQWLKPSLQHVSCIKYQVSRKVKSTPNYLLPATYYIIGGAMAVHKDVFEKIGLLDEKYFLYFEDADFSIRARKAGFKISIAENLSAHHHVSLSAKKLGSPLLLRHHYRNALYFNLKNGPWWVKILVWPWSWVIVIKQLVKLAIRKNVAQSKSILAGVMDFYKNKYGKIKSRH